MQVAHAMSPLRLASLPLVLAALAALTASCREDGSPAPGVVSPQPQPEHEERELTYVGACGVETCTTIGTPKTKGTHVCAPISSSECTWTSLPPDTTVSFRQCEDVECGAKPDIGCPDAMSLVSQTCGAEGVGSKEGPCLWRSTCARPPSTTPCDPSKCPGSIPAIAALCGDGGPDSPVADMKCMQQATGCDWQPVCP